jgi:hypothetical protein
MSGRPAKLHISVRSAHIVIIHISSGEELKANLLFYIFICDLWRQTYRVQIVTAERNEINGLTENKNILIKSVQYVYTEGY